MLLNILAKVEHQGCTKADIKEEVQKVPPVIFDWKRCLHWIGLQFSHNSLLLRDTIHFSEITVLHGTIYKGLIYITLLFHNFKFRRSK